jgi:hypothetical protein
MKIVEKIQSVLPDMKKLQQGSMGDRQGHRPWQVAETLVSSVFRILATVFGKVRDRCPSLICRRARYARYVASLEGAYRSYNRDGLKDELSGSYTSPRRQQRSQAKKHAPNQGPVTYGPCH